MIVVLLQFLEEKIHRTSFLRGDPRGTSIIGRSDKGIGVPKKRNSNTKKEGNEVLLGLLFTGSGG